MAILIKNKSKQLKVYTLTHRPYCTAGGKCCCTPFTTRRPERGPDGSVGIREVTKMVPTSISLLGGERRQVPDATAKVKEVADDIDAGVLLMVKVEQPVDVPSEAPAPSPRRKKTTRKARGKK